MWYIRELESRRDQRAVTDNHCSTPTSPTSLEQHPHLEVVRHLLAISVLYLNRTFIALFLYTDLILTTWSWYWGWS